MLPDIDRSFGVSANVIGLLPMLTQIGYAFWQVFRFAAPGLMAGNAAVLKHASNVPGCALAIEALFREAGFSEHLFRTLMISTRQVEAVIESPLVRAVTLTGSGPAGRAVASKAGAMLKKPCWSSAAVTPTSYSRMSTSILPLPSAPRHGW